MNPVQPKRIILLADDDADDRQIFEDAMMEVTSEVELTTASDGAELMNILDKNITQPGMIFMDLNMPLKNGMQCLAEIKNNEDYKDIPVIIFSTSTQKEAIDQSYRNGADYYICKPDNFQTLKNILTKMFSIKFAKGFTRPSREEFLIC